MATLAEDYKTFFKSGRGRTVRAEVIRITIHQVFLHEDPTPDVQRAGHSRSDMQDWLASIIRFHGGHSRDKTEELLSLVTGAFLEKRWAPIPEVPLARATPLSLPFRCPFRGNAIWKKPRNQDSFHSCPSVSGRCSRATPERALLSKEQPPHRNQEVVPYPYKKTADPFLLDQAVFFLLYGSERAAEVLPSSPPLSPQHSGRLNRRRELLP